jgi:hypothetical protein
VLGTGSLALTLEADPEDDDGRTVTVTADGPAWHGRWSGLGDALVPWAVVR